MGVRGFAEGQSEWGASDSDVFHMALHRTLLPTTHPRVTQYPPTHPRSPSRASVTEAAQVASNWLERLPACQPITSDGREEVGAESDPISLPPLIPTGALRPGITNRTILRNITAPCANQPGVKTGHGEVGGRSDLFWVVIRRKPTPAIGGVRVMGGAESLRTPCLRTSTHCMAL